jgi:iron complex outermembrane receptor protein
MKFRIATVVAFLFCLIGPLSWGQDLSPNYDQTTTSTPVIEDIVIEGKIINQTTEEPLEFATVSIYSESDSSLITGTTTDLDGTFSFQLPADKSYYVEINFLSFKNKTISDISAKEGKGKINLGTIPLFENSQVLKEVEVVAEKSSMQLQMDKRVFNVGKDLANLGGNATDILENVPSVTVDVEGNVSLRGSQNVRMLINGKPSGLTGPDALRQLQGDMIERIEVITNPSARYDAEGDAGIINIILKQGNEKGFNGSFGLNAGEPANYGASYSLNLRRNDFNFFSSFGLRYRESPGGGYNNQEFLNSDGELVYFESDQERTRNDIGGNFRAGINWYMDPKSVLTASILYRKSKEDNNSFIEYRDFDTAGNLTSISTRTEDGEEDESDLEATLSYERTFSSDEHKLTFDFRANNNDEIGLSSFSEINGQGANPPLQRSDDREQSTDYLIQADYVHPLGDNGAKFEIGTRSTLRTIINDFLSEEQNEFGDWEPIAALDDRLKYTENIYAGYAIFGKEAERFSYQLGVRVEYTSLITELQRSNFINDRSFFNLFPSVNLSYKVNDEDQLQLSFSRRISRPRFWFLLPSFSLNDSRNFRAGNPNLNPEFTNSFELGYLKYWSTGSLLSSVYYRRSNGVVERILTLNNDGTTFQIPVNLSQRNAYGIEFSFSQELTKSWDVTANWNFFRAITDGEYEGQRFSPCSIQL